LALASACCDVRGVPQPLGKYTVCRPQSAIGFASDAPDPFKAGACHAGTKASFEAGIREYLGVLGNCVGGAEDEQPNGRRP
jgi:hypothetical protein